MTSRHVRNEPLHLVCEHRYCGRAFEHRASGQRPRFCSSGCQVAERDEKRRDIKKDSVAYLGGACSGCGYDAYPEALQFHHRDPATKGRKISDFARIAKEAQADRYAELDKCILLCANCHAEQHAREARQKRRTRFA